MGLRDFFSRLTDKEEKAPEKIGVRQWMALKSYEELKRIADTISESQKAEEIYNATQYLLPFLKRSIGVRATEKAHRNLTELYNIYKEYEELANEFRDDKELQEAKRKVFTMLRSYAFKIYSLAVRQEDIDFSRPIFISKDEVYIDTLGVLEETGLLREMVKYFARKGQRKRIRQHEPEDVLYSEDYEEDEEYYDEEEGEEYEEDIDEPGK